MAISLLLAACKRGGGGAVTPTPPPLEQARLTGQFLVTLKVTSQKGLLRPISGGSAVWIFKPKCNSGVCDVTWSASPNGSKGTLKNTGIYYSGKFATPANIRSCTGSPNNESVVVRIHVTSATTVNGIVTAAKISGTMTEKNSSPGCKPSMASWILSGFSQNS